MKKILLFGAGKIGRSFVAQLFSRAGYEIVFVDIDTTIINELNRRKSYTVQIKDTEEEKLFVENVRGIHFSQEEAVIKEIVETDIISVSVGKNGLKAVIPLLSKGIMQRNQRSGKPVDVIIAENMRNADAFITKEIKQYMPKGFPLHEKLGLVETSIGKMVPIMPADITHDDPLLVFAEAYNTLILDKKGFINEIPNVKGLAPKENMKAWVDRKLFIHNFGHAATAYLGYVHNPSFTYTWEPLSVKQVYDKVYKVMKQSATVLHRLYPSEFTLEQLNDHINDLLNRFQNKHLGDTIFRVGCDLYRKLAPDDRVMTPLRSGMQEKLPFDGIASVLCAGLDFEKRDELNQLFYSDQQFILERENCGKKHMLTTVCKLSEAELEEIKKAGMTSCFSM